MSGLVGGLGSWTEPDSRRKKREVGMADDTLGEQVVRRLSRICENVRAIAPTYHVCSPSSNGR